MPLLSPAVPMALCFAWVPELAHPGISNSSPDSPEGVDTVSGLGCMNVCDIMLEQVTTVKVPERNWEILICMGVDPELRSLQCYLLSVRKHKLVFE